VTAGRSEQPGVVARFPTQSIIVCSWKQQSTERKWESVDCPWTSRSVGNEKKHSYGLMMMQDRKLHAHFFYNFFTQITSKISYNCKTMNSACRSGSILSFFFFPSHNIWNAGRRLVNTWLLSILRLLIKHAQPKGGERETLGQQLTTW
jgi:hypothetical protein